ncbi:MAG TPA: type II toxin-antitoxin system VapC family toxin [Terriglobales bacterium]|nr:type II toxin-antitoxin system VapC family toxin [Terriglobales bacterium]
MRLALFDTSIYVSALRQGNQAVLTARRLEAEGLLWLSSVVLAELYAGTHDPHRGVIERLERDFGQADRILVPNLRDWTDAGKVLSQLATRYHYEKIGQGRLVKDALIATSAGRKGITVLTTNERDFRRLAEFQPFRWQVADVP